MIASKDLRRPGRLNPVCRVRRFHASMVAPGQPSPIRMGLGRTDAMAPGWHASTRSGQSVKVPTAPVSELQEVNLTPFRRSSVPPQLAQIQEAVDAAEQMIGGNVGVEVEAVEQRDLRNFLASHHRGNLDLRR